MITTRSFSLGLAVIYIAFYPLVALFWKVPTFIVRQKSWLLAFAFINAVISFIRSFRQNFIVATLFLISTILVTQFNEWHLLVISALFVLLVLGTAYFGAFAKAFKPSAVFQAYTTVFRAIRKADYLPMRSPVKNLPVDQLTDEQVTARTNNLQLAVLYNRTCLFLAKKLSDYQQSRVNAITKSRSKKLLNPENRM
jgi:hypothetical protein